MCWLHAVLCLVTLIHELQMLHWLQNHQTKWVRSFTISYDFYKFWAFKIMSKLPIFAQACQKFRRNDARVLESCGRKRAGRRFWGCHDSDSRMNCANRSMRCWTWGLSPECSLPRKTKACEKWKVGFDFTMALGDRRAVHPRSTAVAQIHRLPLSINHR